MPDVEAKLNITAEYKQAFAAIQALGKALDAVQQRAKLALTVTGGGQNGANGAAGAGKAEAEQKAAVEALSAAMKDAAGAAAMLAESVGKLTPALEAMGPQAEQVQKVLSLAENYKQLAVAMSGAADEAAKYNASGAQQGETDARIQRLMAENQKLMELLSSVREEYAMLVKRNAESERARKEREKNVTSVKEELEVTQDLSYQMKLAAMSKRELVAEIERLTKARKEAAKEGDESKYQALTEELKLARQAMTKLRQEQQLNKIATLQQAQAAQALSRSFKSLSDGISNLGEDAKNGSLNLSGMASEFGNLYYQLKAGMGPISAVVFALDLLQTAWNTYAKTAKRTEEAEKDVQETMKLSTEAFKQAADAKQNYLDKKAQEEDINNLKAQYVALNDEIERGVRLLEQTKKEEITRLALTEDAAKHAETLKKAELGRQLTSGQISQVEYDKALAELSRQAKVRQANNEIDAAKIKSENENAKLTSAQKNYAQKEAKANELNIFLEQFASSEEIESMQKSLDELTKRRDERQKKLTEALKKQNNQWYGGQFGITAIELQNEITSLRAETQAADRALLDFSSFIEEKLGTDDIEGYSKRRSHAKTKADIANQEKSTAEAAIEIAKKAAINATEELNATITRAKQEIQQAGETALSEIKTAETKETTKKRKEQEKEASRAAKEAARAAEKAAKRKQEEQATVNAARYLVSPKNKERFSGEAASRINWVLDKGMSAARDGMMSSKELAKIEKAIAVAKATQTKTDDELIKLVLAMLDSSKTRDKNMKQKIEALKKQI